MSSIPSTKPLETSSNVLPVPLNAVESAYDRIASDYDWNYSSRLAQAENLAVCQWLGEAKIGGGKVLDLGCGTGLFLDLIETKPYKYLGVDVSSGMLAEAKYKFPYHNFAKADMESNFFGMFDQVVSLFGSMNYIQPAAIQRLLYRHLVPGGRFFVMLCTPRATWKPDYVLRGSGIHRYLLDRRQVLKLFPESSWTDVRCTGAFSTPSRILNGSHPPLGATLMHLERSALLRWGGGYYHIVTGRKHV